MSKGNTGLVVALTFVATLGGLLFGYDTAVISGAVSAIDHYFINPQHLAQTAASSLSGWTISSALLGCVIGSAVAGWISSRFGRKGGLMIAALMFLVGSIGSAVPELGLGTIGQMGPAALDPFIIYRILGGIGVGVASMISPLYIAEIAPSKIRGRLVSFNQLAIVIGILLVYFVNWFIQSLGTPQWYYHTAWRLMFASEAIPALLFLGLLVFVPDTPRWFVMRGRNAEALAELERVNGPERARSILAKAAEKGLNGGVGTFTRLGNADERACLIELVRLPDGVRKSAENYAPSILTDRMFALCRAFNRFYKNHQVMCEDEQLTRERLALVQTTVEALRWGLSLFGIEPLEQM